MDNSDESYLEANHKSLDPVLFKAQQGDPCHDTKLTEEASEDNLLLPDLWQVSRLQQNLVSNWELYKYKI